jgi:hypothetical protein
MRPCHYYVRATHPKTPILVPAWPVPNAYALVLVLERACRAFLFFSYYSYPLLFLTAIPTTIPTAIPTAIPTTTTLNSTLNSALWKAPLLESTLGSTLGSTPSGKHPRKHPDEHSGEHPDEHPEKCLLQHLRPTLPYSWARSSTTPTTACSTADPAEQ